LSIDFEKSLFLRLHPSAPARCGSLMELDNVTAGILRLEESMKASKRKTLPVPIFAKRR
jgi:hypothetical protein